MIRQDLSLKASSPNLFDDLIGQPLAACLLQAALEQGRLAPAYLFTGPDGVGRRLAALRFLEGVLSTEMNPISSSRQRRRLRDRNHPDLLWVEPTYMHQGRTVPISAAGDEVGLRRRLPPQLRLEQIREVTRFLARQSIECSRGLVVIEGAERMNESAANALLKTLEEPRHGLLLLLTCMPDLLPSTIRSRCQHIPFRRLRPEAMDQVLNPKAGSKQQENSIELLAMAAGSPGALIEHRRRFEEIPYQIRSRLNSLPISALEALSLARELSESLDTEQQLWLISWWQQHLWLQQESTVVLRRLDKLQKNILALVQPRLAWEVALLDLINTPD